ncbi:hypothetical protein OAT18_01485 [Tenacibaculum sp.]|nr:hypothetical protein [Tenacibaculum sp.]
MEKLTSFSTLRFILKTVIHNAKKTLFTIFVLLIIFGSPKKKSEKEKVESALKATFENFDNPNFESFKKITAEKIYCIICFDNPKFTKEPYMVDTKYFFNIFIHKITESKSFKKAKVSTELKIINENNERSDVTAYLTTWQKGELEENHEGKQLGFYLKIKNGN